MPNPGLSMIFLKFYIYNQVWGILGEANESVASGPLIFRDAVKAPF